MPTPIDIRPITVNHASAMKRKAYTMLLRVEIAGTATRRMQEEITPIIEKAKKYILDNISNTTAVHKCVADVAAEAQKKIEYHLNALVSQLEPELFLNAETSDYGNQFNIVVNINYNTGDKND